MLQSAVSPPVWKTKGWSAWVSSSASFKSRLLSHKNMLAYTLRYKWSHVARSFQLIHACDSHDLIPSFRFADLCELRLCEMGHKGARLLHLRQSHRSHCCHHHGPGEDRTRCWSLAFTYLESCFKITITAFDHSVSVWLSLVMIVPIPVLVSRCHAELWRNVRGLLSGSRWHSPRSVLRSVLILGMGHTKLCDWGDQEPREVRR